MLRKIRISLASIFFIAILLIFLDFTGLARTYFGWMAKIQFLPALLAANFIVVGIMLLLTMIFGRIYCSIICPLGVLQDIVSNYASKKKRLRFKYKKAKTVLRVSVLTAFVALTACGLLSLANIIAPYSAFGRIATNLLSPIWAFANNILALGAEFFNSYVFYSTDIVFKGLAVFATSLLTLLIVGFLAWKSGRSYCNTICPVGTILGYVANFSILKPVINHSKCVKCGLCARNCKAECINSKEATIDYTRCVSCFNCIGSCKTKAISYSWRRYKKTTENAEQKNKAKKQKPANAYKSSSKSRYAFLSSLFLLSGSVIAKAQAFKVDGGLAPLKKRNASKRHTRVVPPGAKSIENFANKCTGCQLCVSACPSKVLKPSKNLTNFLQPEMSYEDGYCRVECNECSKVCPAGAILPISLPEKVSTQIGKAVWAEAKCVVNTDKLQCDNCFRQCPTGAIQMVAKNPKNPRSLKIPVIDQSRCIGCGACENLCPARPISAIRVEGNSVHKQI